MAQDVKLANSVTNPNFNAPAATTSGGLSGKQIIAGKSDNPTSVKTSAGQVFKVMAYNVDTAATAYVKLYNVDTAPAVTTDTPVVTIPVPINKAPTDGAVELDLEYGLAFATGIGAACNLSSGATGGTNIGDTGDVIISIYYK